MAKYLTAAQRLDAAKQYEAMGRNPEGRKALAAKFGVGTSYLRTIASRYRRLGDEAFTDPDEDRVKYKEEYPELIIEYFSKPPFETVMIPLFKDKELVYDENGEKVMIPMVNGKGQPVRMPNKIPTFDGFAASVEVATHVLYDWAANYPAFQLAMNRCSSLQKEFLNQCALPAGIYNPQYAKFFAINVTDMRDSVNVTSDKDPFDADSELQRHIEQVRSRNAKALKDGE